MREIAEKAFYNNATIRSVTIPEGVRYIRKGAFCDCHRLKTLTLPKSLLGIEGNAFRRCNGLTEIVIPGGEVTVESCAFADCPALHKVTLAADIKKITGGTFQGSNALSCIEATVSTPTCYVSGNCLIQDRRVILGCKNSTIPDDGSVTSIVPWAFSCCEGLTDLTIPNGVTTIAAYAFYICAELTSVTIPPSVTKICYDAFKNCPKLVLRVVKGSYAHRYAIERGINFKSIEP